MNGGLSACREWVAVIIADQEIAMWVDEKCVVARSRRRHS